MYSMTNLEMEKN